MPSLNLRNPLRRDPTRPTLKQRAATLKATAARLIRKPKPLPAAGSPEAVEAFGVACRAVDAASRLSDADMEALHIAPGASLWTSDKATDALSGNFSRFMPKEIEVARATPRARLEELLILALRRELRMAEAAHSSRIRELHALVYGDEPDAADEDEAPAADEEVDWHNPPAGFMAHPAINPSAFLKIRYGIVAELQRLRGIARAEYARREPYFRESFAQGELEAHLLTLSDELRLAALDAAVADPKSLQAADADLIALGQRFDALHALWREADEADQEPAARRIEAIEAAKARGGPTTEDVRAAWELPGVSESCEANEDAYAALEPVIRQIAAASAVTAQGLAVKARVLIPALWPCGNYERDATLGEGEDWAEQVARQLIEACCSAAGVDWRGQPQGITSSVAGFRDADVDLMALAEPWEAARRFYDQRMEEQIAVSKAAEPGPGEAPAGAGADWQEWHRRCDEWREQTGIADAEDASGDACLALGEIEDRIAAMPAHTLAGLRLKARIAERSSSIDVEWPQGLGDGLMRDLLSITGGLPDIRIVPEAGRATTADPPADLAADLLRDLEECDRVRTPLAAQQDDTPEDGALYQRHWDLRERIDALPSGSALALRVKACAGLIALKWDEDASNTGTGSFLSLATQVVTEVAARPDLLPFRIQTTPPEA